jgi:hypothetical protein
VPLHTGFASRYHNGGSRSKIIEAALKVKIENEDLFDGYQVTYNIF